MSARRVPGTATLPALMRPARAMRLTMTAAGLLAALILAGCAGPDTPENAADSAPDSSQSASASNKGAAPQTGTQPGLRVPKSTTRTTPRIVHAKAPLECVPYARRHVNISLRGTAWTWWRAAKGRYVRGRVPQAGSVLVLKRRGRSLGHIAVVKRIVGPREIIVDHANWLNRGRIHLATPVRDVSKNNDWSAVRVWYTPGRSWGRSVYPAYGFIYPGAGAS